jgi:hypothetical protein
MVTAHQIRSQVRAYIDGKVSLELLDDWILSHTWDASRVLADPSAVALSEYIQGLMIAYSASAAREETIRKELANAIRPFVEASSTSVRPVFRETRAPLFHAFASNQDLELVGLLA